ncbi:hypothetical protein ACSBR1_024739 [Camellia fascicularis]
MLRPKRIGLVDNHPSPSVLIPALRTVGNIVTGDDVQTQYNGLGCNVESATSCCCCWLILISAATSNTRTSFLKSVCNLWRAFPFVAGRKRSTRVRGRTLGKGVQKRIARKKGEKLHVYVNRVLNAITGGNATPATNELGLQIRRLCPLQSVKSWRKINESTKDAVIQAVLDKFVIGDDFDNDEQAQQILDRKAYLLYKDWRYNLKQEFLELEEKGVDDPYSHPPSGVSLDDWRYLIDVA